MNDNYLTKKEYGIGQGLDRKAVVLYLEDLYKLELARSYLCSIRSEIYKKYIRTEKELGVYRINISQHVDAILNKKYDKNKHYGPNGCLTLLYWDSDVWKEPYGVAIFNNNAIDRYKNQVYCDWISSNKPHPHSDWSWRYLSKYEYYLNSPSCWKNTYYFNDVQIYFVGDYCSLSKREREKVDQVFADEIASYVQKELPVAKEKARKKYYDDKRMLQNLRNKWDETNKEANRLEDILKEAYGINILPIQFRDIYAVYYLQGFMKTSGETLSSAMLHYDLKKIKDKLDSIIENQGTIIRQNAQIMAQNQDLQRENQEMLNRLSAIDKNLSNTNQYLEIAANNSTVCAWYAEADYWLNILRF